MRSNIYTQRVETPEGLPPPSPKDRDGQSLGVDGGREKGADDDAVQIFVQTTSLKAH